MHGGSYTESKIRAIRIIRSGWLNVYHHGTSSCQIRHGRDEMRGKGMSRVLRKQLFSIEELLEKANKVLEKKLFAPNVDSDSIIELIADCQNSAISMGEQIEKLYGEGTNCVALLEQYCEDLYQLTQSFDNSNKKREIYNSLNKQLKKLRGLMTSELPDRLEVVFFPYKASMWDSLESVYLAAREDENCDAYCVPIPYFDRNADGSLGQMHYEGNDYPDNIEVTDWQKYNLEERRPDVIYIHNPYDEWNLVTCVHPNYFAKNLKQYTDKLVYIPYFVLDEIEPDDQTAIDGMKHFVWTPGVIYADRVILQSDKMKQIYVNEFIKAAKESGFSGDFVNRRKLEEKFLGTGSPKFDKVKNTRKEDLEIPEEWLKIIQKPDGSWKKIIFYNTSIGALLENSEKMIEKIKDVLKTLYENRDEIALLWRPHPLIETTLTAMRPSLWESYKKIRDEYITGGWGIYDDTPDMDRAVILSDAYYGDQSSVVQLYSATGKSVLIQSVDVIGKANTVFPVSNGIFYNDKMWFVGLNNNCIYSMELDNYNATLEYRIPWGDVSHKKRQYGKVIQKDSKFVLIPEQANHIVVFDMNSKRAKYTKVDVERCGTGAGFIDGVLIDDDIYLIPSSYDRVVCFNVTKGKITKKSPLLSETLHLPGEQQAYAFGGVARVRRSIYFTTIFTNNIVEYNTEMNTITAIKRNRKGDGGGIFIDETSAYLIHRGEQSIDIYDRKAKQMRESHNFPPDFKSGAWNFSQGIVYNKKLFLLPREANMGICFDSKEGKIESFLPKEAETEINYWTKYCYYPSIYENTEGIWVSDYRGYIYIYNENMLVSKKRINVKTEQREHSFQIMDYEEDNGWDNLNYYIRQICEEEMK